MRLILALLFAFLVFAAGCTPSDIGGGGGDTGGGSGPIDPGPDDDNDTVSVELRDGILFIDGSSKDDWIEVNNYGINIIVVSKDKDENILDTWTFPRIGILAIDYKGHEGNDTFKNFTTTNAAVDGGDGDNLTFAGKGENIIYNSGDGSNAFVVTDKDHNHFADALGTNDSEVILGETDRQGQHGNAYGVNGLPVIYSAWSDFDLDFVMDTMSLVYDYVESYKFFQNHHIGNDDPAQYVTLSGDYNSFVGDGYYVAGYNTSDANLVLYSNDFKDNPDQARGTIIHEWAHNWGSFSDANPFYEQFSSISWEADGVTRKDGAQPGDFAYGEGYWLDDGSGTLFSYGASSADEDWAEAVSALFGGGNSSAEGNAKLQEKFDIVDQFKDWLKN
jgi:hypothetical protein